MQRRVGFLNILLSAENRKHLTEALNNAGDTHTVEDVLEMVEGNDASLHIRKHSTVVTQEFSFPQAKQLHFWLAGGDLQELIKTEKEIVKEAKKRGVTKVTIIGRPGWERKLPGFENAGVILSKEI